MNRKDKISLLKAIQAGVTAIDTLQPRLFRMEATSIENGGVCKYYINNKEVDQETCTKEVAKNQDGDEVEIIIDGMEIKEWRDFQNNKKKNSSQKKEQ